MSHANDDAARIRDTRNTARYFTETRHVAWVALVFTVLWGFYAYASMPKRKDPEIPVRVAAAIAAWPGAPAEKIEELITRRIEEKMAENARVAKITSSTRGGVAVVMVELQEGVKDTGKEFDDIKAKLDGIRDLPAGARPIDFLKDFGETTALMLTVASPKAGDVELQLRAEGIRRGIVATRAAARGAGARKSLVYALPATLPLGSLRRVVADMASYAESQGLVKDARVFEGPGWLGIDAETSAGDEGLRDGALRFLQERLRTSELHPDVWRAFLVGDPAETEGKLRGVAEARYSYRDLDNFTDLLKKRLQAVPEVSKVTRSGVLGERVFLEYSQERLASYGIPAERVGEMLAARNITLPGGVLEANGKNVTVDPSGELASENEIAGVVVANAPSGAPVYLRDLFEVSRAYEGPPRFMNKYTWRDARGEWQRTRAITLAISMRSGEQIGRFGTAVDQAIAEAQRLLPEDLVIARTSDQPRQVEENVDLFMSSLYEAVALVVLIALVGFWEWRSALLMALSIPLTLMMTYGFMHLVGIDLQQISIASLIIALGLLVDDPVVASDAIKRDLELGHPSVVAAWLGPTKLARAILFATITNIVAYLPFLTLPGDVGKFIFTLPIVLTASLVASRLVSMTFVPLLGYHLLRAPPARPAAEKGQRTGFARHYHRVVGQAINHRWAVLGVSALLVVAGGAYAGRLKQAFFPKDLSYLCYVDVWLPEDATIGATAEVAREVDAVTRKTLEAWGKGQGAGHERPGGVLRSLTTFVGGGGPRFWFSVTPEQQQPNYAQVLVQVSDKHDTSAIVPVLQRALSAEIAGARVDVRQLENGKPVGVPVAFRLSGDDIGVLRQLAERLKGVLRASPRLERVHDDWGAEAFQVRLEVDADRANLAGVTNVDVAQSSAAALSGAMVGTLREGDRVIPIVSRLRAIERGQLSDLQDLYVSSARTGQRVPLAQVSRVSYTMATEKLRRRNHFRTVTVAGFPTDGTLPSEAAATVRAGVEALRAELPPGYSLAIGGEEEEQKKGFGSLAVVLLISVLAIFLALVIQFKNAVKPLIVFAAIPYGVVGALVCLAVMGSPFGFMAFLGIISLIGVIVSHVIVLFDFIEERHEEGVPLREALLDAGVQRLRPVLVTVGATVFALFPLAAHGGPLWEPLCYAQIGGLTIATLITLVIVPVFYAIVVLDLKLVTWHGPHDAAPSPPAPTPEAETGEA
ncbi:MAG: efflux RND transporter permease subunit [Polyangiaceae bacterium]|nr:efflux RND transporter permease subunit [Polyangiaceae bacterium]